MHIHRLFTTIVLSLITSIAAAFPVKPVRIVIPYGPGSGTDVVIRIIQPALEKQLGVPVVIDNRAGAGGAIGTKAIASAAPDGYTIGMSTVSTFATNYVFKSQAFNIETDFTYITRLGFMPRLMVVNAQFPASTYKGFISELEKNPNKYFYTTVINTVDMLNAEIYKSSSGASMTPVTYSDNSAQARLDLVSNRAQITMDSLPVLTQPIKQGDLKPIAITGRHRNAKFPDVPSFGELGIKELSSSTWYGFVGPAGIGSKELEVLTRALHSALADPVVVEKISALGIDINISTSAEHAADAKTALKLYTGAAKKLNIVPQ